MSGSSYLKAFEAVKGFNPPLDIFTYAQTNIKFKYQHVSCQDFFKAYNEKWNGSLRGMKKPWLARTIVALTFSGWCGVVMPVYHLATGIMEGCFNIRSVDVKYFKAHFFIVIRDLQQSFGWLLSVLHHAYGQYHVEEGKFYSKCCTRFLEHKKVTVAAEQALKREVQVGKTAKQHALRGGAQNIAKAVQAIEQAGFGSSLKEQLFLDVAAVLCEKGELQAARKMICNCFYYIYKGAEKNALLGKIGKGYAVKGGSENLKQAVETLEKIESDPSLQESLFVEIATNLYEKKELKAARTMLNAHSCYKKKDVERTALLGKIAKECATQGDVESVKMAIKMIKESEANPFQSSLALEVGAILCDKGDLEGAQAAIGASSRLWVDRWKQAALLGRIAKEYVAKGGAENVNKGIKIFKEIKKNKENTEVQEEFGLEIGALLFEQGDLEAACSVIDLDSYYRHYAVEKNLFLEKVVKGYAAKGGAENVNKGIKTIGKIQNNTCFQSRLTLEILTPLTEKGELDLVWAILQTASKWNREGELDPLIEKVARGFFNRDSSKTALKVIEAIKEQRELKKSFLLEKVGILFERSSVGVAFDFAKELPLRNCPERNEWVVKIINHYLDCKQWKKAFEGIECLANGSLKKQECLAEVAKHCNRSNYKPGIAKAAKKIFKSSFQLKVANVMGMYFSCSIFMSYFPKRDLELSKFIEELSKEYSEALSPDFSNKKALDIANEIEKKYVNDQTVAKFLQRKQLLGAFSRNDSGNFQCLDKKTPIFFNGAFYRNSAAFFQQKYSATSFTCNGIYYQNGSQYDRQDPPRGAPRGNRSGGKTPPSDYQNSSSSYTSWSYYRAPPPDKVSEELPSRQGRPTDAAVRAACKTLGLKEGEVSREKARENRANILLKAHPDKLQQTTGETKEAFDSRREALKKMAQDVNNAFDNLKAYYGWS